MGPCPHPRRCCRCPRRSPRAAGSWQPRAWRPMSALSTAPPATIAGPVRKPCAMKSRRDTGALWLSCLMGSSRPSVRGLFLRIYMLYSLLNERRAAAEHSAASRFHDRSTTRRARTRGAGDQAIDQARRRRSPCPDPSRRSAIRRGSPRRSPGRPWPLPTALLMSAVDQQIAIPRVRAAGGAEHRGARARSVEPAEERAAQACCRPPARCSTASRAARARSAGPDRRRRTSRWPAAPA